jgi:hypothetical protein
MSASFDPRLDILPESQLRLWPELDTVPSDFILYGGTGLALQLGHRASEDFDFFSSSGFEPDHLRSRLPFFRDLDPKDPETCWVPHAGCVLGGLGWHEDASDSSSGKLEGLRGYSRTGLARGRFADGIGGGESNRHKLRSSDKYSSPTILW